MKSKFMFVLLFFISNAFGQRFAKISETNIRPENIIISNYFAITLPSSEKYSFDINNADTYTQVLKDRQEVVYHILYQTDFSGNIRFVALSNNLSEFFNSNRFPLKKLHACFNKNEGAFFPREIVGKLTTCIIEGLNSLGN